MLDILNREIRANQIVAYPVNNDGLALSHGRVLRVSAESCTILKQKTDGRSYQFNATRADRLVIAKGAEE